VDSSGDAGTGASGSGSSGTGTRGAGSGTAGSGSGTAGSGSGTRGANPASGQETGGATPATGANAPEGSAAATWRAQTPTQKRAAVGDWLGGHRDSCPGATVGDLVTSLDADYGGYVPTDASLDQALHRICSQQ